MSFTPSDEYYQLVGPLYSEHAHASIVPHIFMIRTPIQWNKVGLKFKKDKYGLSNSIKRNKIFYRYKRIKDFNERIIEAIQSQKRYIASHDDVYLTALYSLGVKEEELVRQEC